ncbi:unnamed protein product, partial [Rotaria sp. Silwood1]
MTTEFYKILNRTFRYENPKALEPWFLYLRLLISALEKLPSTPCIVWR